MDKEIIEQNGKKYIEYDLARYNKKRTIINIIFLILLMLAIIALISGIITLLKNKEMLQHEPLTYVMERYDMKACSCLGRDGQEWHSGQQGWEPNYYGEEFIPSYEQPNLSGRLFKN